VIIAYYCEVVIKATKTTVPSAPLVAPAMGALGKLQRAALAVEERAMLKKIEPPSAKETSFAKLARMANQQRALLLVQNKNLAPAGKIAAIQQTETDEDLLGPVAIAYGETTAAAISTGDTSE
jgi:hypothetical protein